MKQRGCCGRRDRYSWARPRTCRNALLTRRDGVAERLDAADRLTGKGFDRRRERRVHCQSAGARRAVLRVDRTQFPPPVGDHGLIAAMDGTVLGIEQQPVRRAQHLELAPECIDLLTQEGTAEHGIPSRSNRSAIDPAPPDGWAFPSAASADAPRPRFPSAQRTNSSKCVAVQLSVPILPSQTVAPGTPSSKTWTA